eukprot:Skav231235  [mRNA]  locus=scaffold813:299058:305087:+ [translate_table: standard]
MNEPDFYDNDPICTDRGRAWCRVKAVLSALDGVLAAEEEAKINAGSPPSTRSFAMRTSIDGKVQGPGTFGFQDCFFLFQPCQDMVAVMEDPSLVEYTLRTPHEKLKKAFYARWVHGLNTQAPWSFVRDFVTDHYKKYDGFGGFPWFIGEYGANGQAKELIVSDLQSMEEKAKSDKHLGVICFPPRGISRTSAVHHFSVLAFHVTCRKVGETGEVCDRKSHCRTWPVTSPALTKQLRP